MTIIDIRWLRVRKKIQAVLIAHEGRKMDMVTVTAGHIQASNFKLGDRVEIRKGRVSLLETARGVATLPAHCPQCREHVCFDGVNLICESC